MMKTNLTVIAFAGAAALLTSAWLTNAGPITPPAGPVASTGATTQELADLITGPDPCMCGDFDRHAIALTDPNQQLLAAGTNRYIKRVNISKNIASAEVYLQLREIGGPVIGFYRLRPDEGSLVVEVDVIVNGLQAQLATVSSGNIQMAILYKDLP